MVVEKMQLMMGGDWRYQFGAEVGSLPNNSAKKLVDCSEASEAAVRWAAESVGSPLRLTDGSFAQYDACYRAGTLIPLAQARETPGSLVFLSRVPNVTPGMGRNGIFHVGLVKDSNTVLEACCQNGDRIVPCGWGKRAWHSMGGLIPGVVYAAPPPAQPTPPRPEPAPPTDSTFVLAFEGGGSMTLRYLKRTNPMMTGGDVKSLQGVLNQKGFNAGSEDGKFGDGTKAAVIRAQAAMGLTRDGVAGPATHERLWER